MKDEKRLRLVVLPNPLPCETIERPDDAPEVRRLHCSKYNGCLTRAYRADWPSFTCNQCHAFEEAGPEERKCDLGGLGDMLQAVFRPGTALRNPALSEMRKKEYARRRELGLCVMSACPRLAMDGRACCEVHAQKAKVSERAKRRAAHRRKARIRTPQ